MYLKLSPMLQVTKSSVNFSKKLKTSYKYQNKLIKNS